MKSLGQLHRGEEREASGSAGVFDASGVKRAKRDFAGLNPEFLLSCKEMRSRQARQTEGHKSSVKFCGFTLRQGWYRSGRISIVRKISSDFGSDPVLVRALFLAAISPGMPPKEYI